MSNPLKPVFCKVSDGKGIRIFFLKAIIVINLSMPISRPVSSFGTTVSSISTILCRRSRKISRCRAKTSLDQQLTYKNIGFSHQFPPFKSHDRTLHSVTSKCFLFFTFITPEHCHIAAAYMPEHIAKKIPPSP